MPFSSTVIMMGCSLAICLSSRMSKGLQNLGSNRRPVQAQTGTALTFCSMHLALEKVAADTVFYC